MAQGLDASSKRRRYYQVSETEWADVLRLRRSEPGGSLLIRGATVVTMDPDVPDLQEGDVLVKGSQIVAVGEDLSMHPEASAAVTMHAGGMILCPGFVDGHRHSWQNQFRRLIADANFRQYLATTHGGMALKYRPEDMYWGNIASMLGSLANGITTVVDVSHNSRSAAHSDAVFRSYADSGIRAVHVATPPNAGDWDRQWPDDMLRLRDEHCSAADSLITMRFGIDGVREPSLIEQYAWAREHGFAITQDAMIGGRSAELIELDRTGTLGSDATFIHCTSLTEAAWAALAANGCSVTLAPTSDALIGLGDGVPPVDLALAHGIRPGLSVDVEISLSSDMFTQMRSTVVMQRMLATMRQYSGETSEYEYISSWDVLDFATRSGAVTAGLSERVGRIAPGLQADLLLIRAEEVTNLPLNNAVGTIVLGTEAHNIDAVMIGGTFRKWRGELLDVDIDAVREGVRQSRDYVAAESGLSVNPIAPTSGRREFASGEEDIQGHLANITRV